MSKIVLIILCSILTVNAQYSNSTNQSCNQHNQQILKLLNADNTLSWALKRNLTGDGILQLWMKKMKLSNVKHATAVVGFDYQGQEIKLSLQAMNFYNQYYYFGSEAQIKNINEADNSLNEALRLPFFNKALELIDSFKIKNKSCGRLYLHLLDDGCLPVIYDTNTLKLGRGSICPIESDEIMADPTIKPQTNIINRPLIPLTKDPF
jgi:hypothetical protein